MKIDFRKTPLQKGTIKYYKISKRAYQLAETYRFKTSLRPEHDIYYKWFTLCKNGDLIIREDYCWDGSSGPTIQTSSTMRTALIHDVLYQMFRLKLVDIKWRQYADGLLRDLGHFDGMYRWRTWLWYKAVEKFAVSSSKWKNRRMILIAPKKWNKQ